jgi:hypothetical protein
MHCSRACAHIQIRGKHAPFYPLDIEIEFVLFSERVRGLEAIGTSLVMHVSTVWAGHFFTRNLNCSVAYRKLRVVYDAVVTFELTIGLRAFSTVIVSVLKQPQGSSISLADIKAKIGALVCRDQEGADGEENSCKSLHDFK